MLEAMQERQVTILGETLKLPSPFFVVATQNPLEMDGTYPLPEAQLDDGSETLAPQLMHEFSPGVETLDNFEGLAARVAL